ncbi:MAG: hypothetical protein KDD67_11920 [Ignavibacteriae bacterium]|nr:hypothetical protein [Ignavibacteriota bacterium]MCB9214919.1 hypothetical protein [Ignavibacteria bacterium]
MTVVCGISITPRPNKIPFAPQLGFWSGNNENVFGLTTNAILFPSTLSYVHYNYLDETYYLSYQLHIAQLLPTPEGGFTPSIEGDLGLHGTHGFYRHGLKVGIAFMPDLSGSWLSRWNIFSSSPRAAFLPVVGYDAFAGPVTLSALWYPGMTAHLIEKYRKPKNESDTGFYFEASQLQLEHFFPPADSGYLTPLQTRLPDSTRLRISKFRAYYDDGTPLQLLTTRKLVETYVSPPYDYYWVMVDEGSIPDAALYSRLMALDTATIAQYYHHTGRLVIKDNPQALKRLDSIRVPILHDIIFNGSFWGWREKEKN